eukprot:TRINITY_DN57453_c0_g2_i1.p2 TRINITY_DN57453_c0_g2~~TRINITY_DN57453_c0_g2_i1.p2  ORF type:complete len:101 (+),score=6.14 TRINITY_DN57453_c0_g2_i1:135-437(+)
MCGRAGCESDRRWSVVACVAVGNINNQAPPNNHPHKAPVMCEVLSAVLDLQCRLWYTHSNTRPRKVLSKCMISHTDTLNRDRSVPQKSQQVISKTGQENP